MRIVPVDGSYGTDSSVTAWDGALAARRQAREVETVTPLR